MTSIVQDIRFAIRRLFKDRSFTAAAVSALALGIGANGAVFTLVNAALLRSLPFAEPDRIMRISMRNAPGRLWDLSLHDFEDVKRASRTFSAMALVRGLSMNISADAHAPEQYPGSYITANGFRIIGQAPVIGRGFSDDDDRAGVPAVVLLSHRLWQNRYGADPSVLGKMIRVNTEPATVIGVMPEGMNFPFNADLWVPMTQIPPSLSRVRNTRDFLAFGRLADGVTAAQAHSELDNISAQLATEYPDTNRDMTTVVRPYAETTISAQTQTLYWSLMGAVGFVLLIACANVANLLLARTAERSREIAVRVSIGATRWRIVRQLLIESILLAIVSGVVGLGLAYAGIQWYDAATVEVGRPYWWRHTMDAVVLAFLVGVCLVTAVAFGLAPALYVSKTSANEVLKDSGRSGLVGVRARGWTTSLMVAQLALTLVLLSGAGFMMRSFLYLYRVDVGFDTSRLVTMALVLPPRKYAEFEDRLAFLDRLDERLNAISTIERASTANYLPVGGGSIRRLAIEGRPEPDQSQPSIVTMMAVGSRYFDVLRVPVRRGRAFVTSDGQPGREAALINERLAALYFPGEDPIGKRIRLINDGAAPEAPKFYAATIVGVAPTIRQRSVQDVDPDPIVYITHRQDVLMGFAPWIVVRTKADPAPTMAVLRQEVATMDPDIPLTNVRTMDEILALIRWRHRIFGTMFAVFAAIAMVLAAVGLYGVTAYSVAQRKQEIGIRMAIGAQPAQVWWLVLQRGCFQLCVGLVIGLAGALGVGKVLESQLVRTEPADPVTLAAVSAVLIVVAIAACFWPARRATRLDPVKALRYE